MTSNPESWLLDELGCAGRENLDEVHVARYDVKEDAQAAEEVRLLEDGGLLGPESTVVDLGAGTGQALGHGAAQLARAADDDGHLAVESEVVREVRFRVHW